MLDLAKTYPILLQDEGEVIGGIFGCFFFLIYLVLIVVVLASLWKIFTKAGKPGWAAIVPIYNLFMLCEIVGRPWWWLLLCFIPCVNIVVMVMLMFDLAKSFGKSVGYGIGLCFLGIIFLPMLAFGDSRYQGPAATA